MANNEGKGGFLTKMLGIEVIPPGNFDGVTEGHAPLPWFTTLVIGLSIVTAFVLTFPIWGERTEKNLADAYAASGSFEEWKAQHFVAGPLAQDPTPAAGEKQKMVGNIFSNNTAVAKSEGGFAWWDQGYTAALFFIIFVLGWTYVAVKNCADEGY